MPDRAGIVLCHGADGPAALLGEWLEERAMPFAVHDVSAAPVPALGEAAFVVSLGSERSVNDTAIPWVAAELELLRTAVSAAVPVLGLCFGGQALSVALGGEVAAARAPQIGWFELSGDTAEIASGPWFHWHYEQLAVPPGGRELARSPVGPAAFRHGPHLGTQFHPEVTTGVIATWSRSEAELAKLGIERDALVAESERRAQAARTRAWTLFDAWLASD